ncbi:MULTISPECIES: hypothetical protein [Sorangium]|uniref:Protein kinase domain-containing protein n=1 Tax=Sorangium cellulosum TaxID=56 RepID=A0A4P2QUN8_SORCE|nr:MULTISPECIES: hypothetical protein [Sorangium]AUX33273.1 uncharacterized protein SOCE836_054280 [Sorangium cellulosum]WCQ92588.1 Serine/threonine-protein kinase PknD [Sorangium sp. Soce836]
MSVEVVEGAIFAGRYRLIRRLAAGAMGAVYEALHLGTDRRWALKVMLSHIIERPELRRRFELEARVTAPIESPYIVEVFDAGVDDATAQRECHRRGERDGQGADADPALAQAVWDRRGAIPEMTALPTGGGRDVSCSSCRRRWRPC